jgi:hypothetical protein
MKKELYAEHLVFVDLVILLNLWAHSCLVAIDLISGEDMLFISLVFLHVGLIIFSLTTLIPERQVWIRKNKWKFTSLLLKTIFFIVGQHCLIFSLSIKHK